MQQHANSETYGREEYLRGPGEMQGYWREYLGTTDPRDPLAVPAYADLRGLPPALLMIPECDVLREDSFAMADRLGAAKVNTHVLYYPGATHSFLEAVSMADVSNRAFLRGCMRVVRKGVRTASCETRALPHLRGGMSGVRGGLSRCIDWPALGHQQYFCPSSIAPCPLDQYHDCAGVSLLNSNMDRPVTS